MKYVSMCTKALAPMTRRSPRSGILNGDCMLVAEYGTLLPRNAAVKISSPQKNR